MFIHYSYKVGCEYDLIATHFKSDKSYKLFTSEIHFFTAISFTILYCKQLQQSLSVYKT